MQIRLMDEKNRKAHGRKVERKLICNDSFASLWMLGVQ